ncbi:MAG: LamG-like jellyroll fold domain-containing protein, partial [Verrucomicrobiia bacterium]
DDEKVLVNDPDNENAIKAYNIGNSTGRAAVVSIMPTPGKKRVESTSSIEVMIENGSETTVDQSSVKMTLNGKDVDVDVSKSGDIVTISYTGGLAVEAFCCVGVINTAIVSFKESNGNERSREWSFDVQSTNRPGAAGTLVMGLIGHWPLDEGSGTTAANTVSGGSDAELHNGVEWVDDPDRGMVLSFDGVDGYADAGAETIHQMTQDNDFTWSVWINQGSGNGPNNVVLGNRYSPGGGDFAPREFIKFTPTKFEFHLDGGGQNCEYIDLVDSEGEWVHYVVVKTGNTLTHYSHGEEGESSTFTSELQNPQPFYFGGDQTSENWNGMLDDIAIWDRALSAAEVADLTSGGIPVPVQVVPGLIAYWPFDGNLYDAIGDNHGEAMGTDDIGYTGGQFGEGIALDGIDQFVQIPVENEEMFDFQDGTGFSISAWFTVDSFSKNWQALIAKGEGNRWRVHRRGGENVFTANGGNGDVSQGTTDVSDGGVHHIVLVSDPDGGEVRFYVDGELEGTSGAPAIQSNDNPMMIGENPDARNRTWHGMIDDVGIWDRPITEEEIALIYNDGGGTALVSAGAAGKSITWDFNDGLPEGSEVAGTAEHSEDEGVDGSGALVLTRALGSQLGGWLSAEVGTVSSFTIDFDILMDGGTATQADGISMAIADDLVPFAAFGEVGVGSGLRVNFDNWDNGDGAPSIEIEFGGNRIASVPMGTQAASTLDTDGWWPVHIELTSDGDLTLLYNDEFIHDRVNIADFAPIENARIAFGARTGGANANQFIDNFKIVLAEETVDPDPVPETPAPAELPWSVGLNDDGWPAGDGGGANTTFV